MKAKKQEQPKEFRRFLIRRQRSLEILFTNGLYFWVNPVPQSETNPPYEISDIILSRNKQTLLVYYSPYMVPSQVHLKTFKAAPGDNFEVYEDKIMMGTKNMKNITLDNKGQLFSIRVEKFRSAKSVKIIRNIFVDKTSHELTIRIPEILLNKEMFETSN